jgi:glycosyltransferase involved in cell wall biosynthesis
LQPVPNGRRAAHTYLVHPVRGARDEHTPQDRGAHETAQTDIELSVVMPCLNEADTLAICIRKARRAMEAAGIAGEVVVADNGSTDSSIDIAEAEGARVVPVADKGYGAALMGGIQAARGRFVIMGDADDSYDFGELPKFVEHLRQGDELVQGCRLASGGGRVLPGAMPRLHRWLGNPMFSRIARRWFRAPVHDIYCGLRGFTKSLYERLDQRCTGMEFATEMIIKASLAGARIGEVPITLHPDGRTTHPPHLKTFRDGWRTLRFFLMCTPRRLFLIPGLMLLVFGLAGYTVAMPRMTIGRMTFDAHTLLFASLAVICGYQSMLFAAIAKTFAITEGVLPPDPRVDRFSRLVPLERGLVFGLGAAIVGAVMLLAAVNEWRVRDFGRLDYADTMRIVVPGVTLAVLGYQTILSCFFLSLLTMRRR